MLFNSYLFILLFLPLTLLGYYLFGKRSENIASWWLILASFIFYGYYNPMYLFILVTSIGINYVLSKWIVSSNPNQVCDDERSTKSNVAKRIEIIALILNVGILFCFKYFNFFIDNINAIFRTNYFVEKIALPLGISFFTFQQISFIVDSYNGEVDDYSFREYCLFVSFFPQLVAGPIVTHSEIIPQFKQKFKNFGVDWDLFAYGIRCFCIGLFKKVIIADSFAFLVNAGYSSIDNLSSIEAWITIVGYTFQLYFDFSGYCDMATGIAAMFGIQLPLNFDSPYKSLSISEFWTRWHMSLNRFLTKYVYIPLGGNRKGMPRTCKNLLIVFLISGIWHGAAWTFVIWGLGHGIAVVLYRIFRKWYDLLPKTIRWFVTFLFVNIMWVFFRAESIGQAIKMIQVAFSFIYKTLSDTGNTIMLGFTRMEMKVIEKRIPIVNQLDYDLFNVILFFTVAFVVVLLIPPCVKKNKIKLTTGWMLMLILAFEWSLLSLSRISEFLYFGF